MFRFLMNLFNIGKKKADGKQYFREGDTVIIVDSAKGEMIIKSSRRLSEEELFYFFEKYIQRGE